MKKKLLEKGVGLVSAHALIERLIECKVPFEDSSIWQKETLPSRASRYIARSRKQITGDPYALLADDPEPEYFESELQAAAAFNEWVDCHVMRAAPICEWPVKFILGSLCAIEQREFPAGQIHEDDWTDIVVVVTIHGSTTEIETDEGDFVQTPSGHALILLGQKLVDYLQPFGFNLRTQRHRSPKTGPEGRRVLIGRYFRVEPNPRQDRFP